MTQSAFDRGFTRMASAGELDDGNAHVYRAGGVTLLLIRDGSEVLAFDGSCVAQDRSLRGNAMVRAIVECLEPASAPAQDLSAAHLRRETDGFRDWPRFAAVIEGDGVWVDVNGPAIR